ncbi:MAG: hypothetical protein UT35_C0013G0002 [Candidatus Yanofskybacteria bacterium GW2011_GWD1_39_16]|uniref:Uncharacterized protein n=1 Tax=Candidatus Yanofskybacteria bacterium GW2011_GWD1_39_16 TaxID=1619030 RepID=A0A837HPR4_9BACT|nr:MAG: hypothetical protein UT35_C0013G0002 [Candidatus Yanofskybacteria bacterium GW2011_GWD1_39_16]
MRNVRYVSIFIALAVLIVPIFSSASQTTGGDITNFDVNPKIIKSNSTTDRNLEFKIDLAIYGKGFREYCGSVPQIKRFTVYIMEDLAGEADTKVLNPPYTIDDFNSYLYDSTPYKNTFNTKILVTSCTTPKCATRNFYAMIYCGGGYPDKMITESSRISVTQPFVSSGTYACNAGGVYACGTKADCSDTVGCSATTKAACAKVDSNLCGKSFGGGTGTGNIGTPGTTQNYQFTIPNWLKGQPSSLTDLLDIIAKWLFNLAIPVAVGLIIYAGVLLMTAGPNPANVKKGGAILKWVAIGLAIIFINKGFISLIRSVLELGNK